MATENLNIGNEIGKVKDIINTISICMLSTYAEQSDFPYTIPMISQEVDDEGNIWFLFSTESDTYENLKINNNISLNFAHADDYKFLNIDGVAQILVDDDKLSRYLKNHSETWFDKNDKTLRILKVTPRIAHYWDNHKNTKLTLKEFTPNTVIIDKLNDDQ